MDDLISRRAALAEVHKSVFEFFDICDDDEESPVTWKDEQLLELNKTITTRIKNLPTAEPSTAILKVEVSAEEAMETVKNKLSDYFDTLWKTAYERGKAEADPRKGKWIDYCGGVKCDQCGQM